MYSPRLLSHTLFKVDFVHVCVLDTEGLDLEAYHTLCPLFSILVHQNCEAQVIEEYNLLLSTSLFGGHACKSVSTRQHTSAYVSIRQQSSGTFGGHAVVIDV